MQIILRFKFYVERNLASSLFMKKNENVYENQTKKNSLHESVYIYNMTWPCFLA